MTAPDSILDEIVASKRREVASARQRMPLEEMEDQAASAPPVRGRKGDILDIYEYQECPLFQGPSLLARKR